jgi:Uma2 family endonuclease
MNGLTYRDSVREVQRRAKQMFIRKGDAFMTIIKRSDEPIRADHVPGPPQGQWTYDHYATIPDDGQRYEIVDGVLYMSPAPSEPHQDATGLIYYYLTTYVRFPGLGKVLFSPFDVELSFSDVVQPDVLVLLKENGHKSIGTRIVGGPDLVVEVASPTTAKYDRQKKSRAYAQAGVKEYWIARPLEHTVEVFVLEADTYCSVGVFSGEQTLPTTIVVNFPVQVRQFFPETA